MEILSNYSVTWLAKLKQANDQIIVLDEYSNSIKSITSNLGLSYSENLANKEIEKIKKRIKFVNRYKKDLKLTIQN